jgi:hypothetical protein
MKDIKFAVNGDLDTGMEYVRGDMHLRAKSD